MKLEKLQIIGFKSFPDKTLLEFGKGITCIVGPNGCGKTNVVDAIRWALGEQNPRLLRGEKMEDIIFNGTQKRKPLGMAEISITFTNTEGRLPLEYQEVMVARRVFRDGASEYLLNKNPCRLKDIRDLLMDAGLGNFAYSLIQQNMIDAVLSNKANERRYLFEQAAGILKYKIRRNSATNKLKSTMNDLQRLEDVLNEVEHQVLSLERQVNKAKRYEKLIKEIRERDINLNYFEYNQLEIAEKPLIKQIKSWKNEQEKLQQQIIIKESEIELKQIDILEKETKLLNAREDVDKITHQVTDLEEKVLLAQERIKHTEKELSRNRKEVELLYNAIKETDEQIISETDKVKLLNDKYKSFNITFEEANEQAKTIEIEYIKYKEEEKKLYQQLNEPIKKQRNKEKELAKIKTRIEEIEIQEYNLLNDTKDLNIEFEDLEFEIKEINKIIIQIENKKGNLSEAYNILNNTYIKQEKDVKELQEKLSRLENELYKCIAEEKLLSGLNRRKEGYNEGVKYILNDSHLAKENKIKNILAELIEFPGEYELALETLLGEVLQYIYIENIELAKVGLDELAQKGKGRVTFVFPNLIDNENETEIREIENIILAHNLISPDSEIEKWLIQLLRGIGIVEDLEQAYNLYNMQLEKIKRNEIHTLITLQGEILRLDGTLTGGTKIQEESSF